MDLCHSPSPPPPFSPLCSAPPHASDPGPVLEIVNASGGLVYSAGSYLSMECLYLNTSLATTYTTTHHPFLPVQHNTPLQHTVLRWTFNNRTFSLKNRKR